MEGQLLWVLIVQLCVIVFVAVCILIFILKKLVGRSKVPTGSKTILVTAADRWVFESGSMRKLLCRL